MVRRNHALASLIALPAIALLAAGCGGGGGTVAAASSPAPTLKVASKAKVGRVLVDAQGRTLYRYTPDHGGKSTCTGTCAKLWPPATVQRAGRFTATGIKGTVGTTTRPGGAKQLTFNGMPLYRFAQDTSTADAKGQGVEHIWFVIPAKKSGGSAGSSGSGSTGTSSTKSSGGYGY